MQSCCRGVWQRQNVRQQWLKCGTAKAAPLLLLLLHCYCYYEPRDRLHQSDQTIFDRMLRRRLVERRKQRSRAVQHIDSSSHQHSALCCIHRCWSCHTLRRPNGDKQRPFLLR